MQALALIGALADELASSAGALLGTTGIAAEVEERGEIGWIVPAEASGARTGRLALGFAAADARALARQAMGFDEDPDDAVVADMLREVCGQAFGAVTQLAVGKGARFSVDAPERGGTPLRDGVRAAFRLKLGDALSTIVTLWDASRPAESSARPAPEPARPREPEPVNGEPAPAVPAPARSYPNLDVILDIDLPLSVRFGETEMTLDALTKLAPGSVIDLGRSPDDPVEVLVNGRMVARGEVVVVNGSYGVRITEVVSAADRLRSVAA